ncbi:MAG: hypothetical protein U1F43_25650 [Myxococcota bacterium]
MGSRSPWFVGVLVAGIAGCGSLSGADDVAPLSAAAELPLDTPPVRHAPSGMLFPARLAGLERDAVGTFDGLAEDLSVGYHRIDAAVAMTATVYVYPSSGSLHDDFVAAEAAVLQQRPGATLLAEGRISLEEGGKSHEGWRAHYLVRDPSGKTPPQISHLFLFQHGPWRLKYRATFFARQHAEADQALLRFMRALPWPELDLGQVAMAYDRSRLVK